MHTKFPPRPWNPQEDVDDSRAWADPVETHRASYERNSMARAEAVDASVGSGNLNMFSQAERTRQGNSLARSQAAYMPEWDKWFQAAGIGGKTSFGMGSDTGGFGTSLPAGYTPNQLAGENLNHLTGGQVPGMEGQSTTPRWAGSANLPASEQQIGASLRGLQGALKKRKV